jgi:gamma-glutamyl phosphate reductase
MVSISRSKPADLNAVMLSCSACNRVETIYLHRDQTLKFTKSLAATCFCGGKMTATRLRNGITVVRI